MTNNNVVKFMLFLAIIFIWGTLGFKILNRSETDHSPNISTQSDLSNHEHQPVEDNFSLLLNYKDPFLRTKPSKKIKKKESGLKVPPKTKKKEVLKEVYKFPEIKYKGFIEHPGNSKVALVKLSGNLLHWKKNELFEKITLTEIFQDSIIVSHEKNKKTILKEHL